MKVTVEIKDKGFSRCWRNSAKNRRGCVYLRNHHLKKKAGSQDINYPELISIITVIYETFSPSFKETQKVVLFQEREDDEF